MPAKPKTDTQGKKGAGQSKKIPTLTDKQERFAVAYVQTANAAEAYRMAYDVAPDSRDEWLYVEACQLLDHPKISPRIKELQEQAKERSQYTVMQALDEYEQARNLATTEKNPSAAVSAITGKVKLLGMDKPRRVEVTGKNGEAIKTEDVSARDIIAGKLAGLAARSGQGSTSS